jgi:hypothetical protein
MSNAKASTKARKSPDIVAAMNSQALFAPWFKGPSWDGWRAVLKAAYCLPMTKAEIEFFRSVAERDPPKKRVRELWVAAGRRAGKDSIASMIAAHAAALFTGQDRLRPGERAMVACVSFDKATSRIILDYTRAYFGEISLFKQMVQNDDRAEDLALNNGVDIAILTNNFRAVRGRPILCAVFDEIAFWRDENSVSPDVETYNAIKPGLVTLAPDSLIVGISSPYRKGGLLYSKYKKHYGRNDDHTLVIKAPTRLLNPTVPQEEIDRDLEEDPAKARAEWLAEFRDDIGSWLDVATIEAAVDRGVTVRPPRAGVAYVGACDPAGGSGTDSFTAAVSHAEPDGAIILDALLEIRPPYNPSSAVEQVCQLLKSYNNLSRVVGDRYSAGWVVEAFAKHGIRYVHSDRDRSAVYADAVPLFTSGRAHILDVKRLVSQFASLERRVTPGGRDKIDAPRGAHEDCANSAAIAMTLATKVEKPMFIAPPYAAYRQRDWGSPNAGAIHVIDAVPEPPPMDSRSRSRVRARRQNSSGCTTLGTAP